VSRFPIFPPLCGPFPDSPCSGISRRPTRFVCPHYPISLVLPLICICLVSPPSFLCLCLWGVFSPMPSLLYLSPPKPSGKNEAGNPIPPFFFFFLWVTDSEITPSPSPAPHLRWVFLSAMIQPLFLCTSSFYSSPPFFPPLFGVVMLGFRPALDLLFRNLHWRKHGRLRCFLGLQFPLLSSSNLAPDSPFFSPASSGLFSIPLVTRGHILGRVSFRLFFFKHGQDFAAFFSFAL